MLSLRSPALALFFSGCLLAQTTTFTPQNQSPLATVGLLLIISSIVRRKHAIGGWLFYFMSQVLLGAFVTLYQLFGVATAYTPGAWEDKGLYLLFLMAGVPSLIITSLLAVCVVMLARTRAWPWVIDIRGLLVAEVAFGVLSLAIDLVYFPNDRNRDILTLVRPAIFLPYFFVSKRVQSVFRDKTWNSGSIQAAELTGP